VQTTTKGGIASVMTRLIGEATSHSDAEAVKSLQVAGVVGLLGAMVGVL
jgi:hypothetical protein